MAVTEPTNDLTKISLSYCRDITVTVWKNGKPYAVGTVYQKLKNEIRLRCCVCGQGVEQLPAMRSFQPKNGYLFTSD